MFAPGAVQTKKEHRQNYLLLTGGAEKSATYTIEHTQQWNQTKMDKKKTIWHANG